MLKEKTNIKIAAHRIQNNVISDENITRPRMSATAKEHAPNMLCDKNESKEMNEDK